MLSSSFCMVFQVSKMLNSRELHLLLLSSYGSTLNEVDLKICNSMHEIESINGSDSDYC